MKINEYWRLAKISLKARKKETRSTVRGMSFSLIIIVPLLFTIIGVNQGMLRKLNAHPEELYAKVYSVPESSKIEPGTTWSIRSNNYNIRYSSYNNEVSNHEKVMDKKKDTYLKYTVHDKSIMSGGTSFFERAYLNGVKHKVSITDNFNSSSLLVVDKDQMGMLNNLIEPYCTKFKGFTGTGKKEVIVNEKYLKAAGISVNDALNSDFGVYYRDETNDGYIIIEEYGVNQTVNNISHYLFNNFKIVGVLKDNPAELNDIKGATFIVSSASYYNSNGEVALAPVRKPVKVGSNLIEGMYYGNYKETDKLTSEYVFPGAFSYADKKTVIKMEGNNINFDTAEKQQCQIICYYYQGKDFTTFDKELSAIFPEFKNDGSYQREMDFKSLVGSGTYANFVMLANISNIGMLVAGVFGGVILFAALVNLFNSVKHSVDSRRNYLGVMKAIGARSSTIPKMYFFEIIRIFVKVYLRVVIIGSAICFGILVGVYYMGEFTPLQLSIDWELIPIVMGILGVILLVVGLIYSLGCTLSLSKKPITELLEG